MGQDVPPDAEEQLPGPLSLFHAEEREEGRARRPGVASQWSAAWNGHCWLSDVRLTLLSSGDAEAPENWAYTFLLLVAGSSPEITQALAGVSCLGFS